MKFSVLMPVYVKERPEYLFQSLDSVFKQSVSPDEVVLVKDGALTSDLNFVVDCFLERYSTLKVVPLATNHGPAYAANVGLQNCTHDLVARMDSDDISYYRRFEEQLQVFNKNPELDVVSAWIDEFSNYPTQTNSIRRVPEKQEEIKQFAHKRCPVNQPVTMLRKKAVFAVGGYTNQFYLEDYDLWIKMLMNGSKFYNIQKCLLHFRFLPATFSRRGGWKYAMDEWRMMCKFRKMGFFSDVDLWRNTVQRFPVRLMPNAVRGVLYKLLTR